MKSRNLSYGKITTWWPCLHATLYKWRSSSHVGRIPFLWTKSKLSHQMVGPTLISLNQNSENLQLMDLTLFSRSFKCIMGLLCLSNPSIWERELIEISPWWGQSHSISCGTIHIPLHWMIVVIMSQTETLGFLSLNTFEEKMNGSKMVRGILTGEKAFSAENPAEGCCRPISVSDCSNLSLSSQDEEMPESAMDAF